MAKKPNLENYVEVNERIEKFYEKYPEGSLQSSYEFIEVAGQNLVVVTATAHRWQEDPTPAYGQASEPIPGLTPYTKNSELMNAETSAWGRALAALGFEVKRSVASREEVRNRTNVVEPSPEEQKDTGVGLPENVQSGNGIDAKAPARALAVAAQDIYKQLVEAKGDGEAKQMVSLKLSELGVTSLEEMSPKQAQDFHDYLKGLLPA